MRTLLEDAMEAGLAANQVGILNRVFVYRGEPEAPVRALINPVIDWASEETEPAEEGCLSIPGIWIEVSRPVAVRVSGLDEDGEPVRDRGARCPRRACSSTSSTTWTAC